MYSTSASHHKPAETHLIAHIYAPPPHVFMALLIKIDMRKHPVTFCVNEPGKSKRSVREPEEIRKKKKAQTLLRPEMSIYN